MRSDEPVMPPLRLNSQDIAAMMPLRMTDFAAPGRNKTGPVIVTGFDGGNT